MLAEESLMEVDSMRECSKCSGLWRPYIVLLNSPEFEDSVKAEAKATSALPSGWLTMAQAAAMMGFSYFWLSRNWKQLGLRPTSPKSGSRARRMFEAKEIDEFMRAKKFTRRGRPRKTKELNA